MKKNDPFVIRRRRERSEIIKGSLLSSSQRNRMWALLAVSIVGTVVIIGLILNSNATSQIAVALVPTVISLLFLLVWYLPKIYVESQRTGPLRKSEHRIELLQLEDATRKTVAQTVGGAVLLGSLIFTYSTFRMQQDGQVTDRFTSAVEQIGSDKIEVRLGGLYALERIANDSERDYWTVMEVLAAFVRERAKKKKDSGQSLVTEVTSTNADNSDRYLTLSTDIQAALTIIGRRNVEKEIEGASIELWETSLVGTTLRDANLRNVNLHKSDLKDSFLVRVDLRGANLNGANLSGVLLADSDLRGAHLDGATNLGFDFIKEAIIDEETRLPDYLKSRREELLESSKKNLEKLGKPNEEN